MDELLLHSLPKHLDMNEAPGHMSSPYTISPHPWAQAAAHDIIDKVRAYMRAHEESELHRLGKMFGVLVVKAPSAEDNKHYAYLSAFSAQLDGSYLQKGFVPPVYMPKQSPIGTTRDESRRLQRLLFANYQFINTEGQTKNLLDIFAKEKPIYSPEEWFNSRDKAQPIHYTETLPPSGAGDCCAPKLLQYALIHDLQPLALAEFWIGASPKNELRQEGFFYAPCSSRCVPILRWMLGEIDTTKANDTKAIEVLYEDEWLMVVNKPAGMLSVTGKTGELSLAEVLKQQRDECDYLQPVHRLDQDTSGLIVLAKTLDIYTTLQSYFQRRDIRKRYEALVRINGTQNRSDTLTDGDISLPLLPNPFDRPRQMVNYEHGKQSMTHYHIREYRADGAVFIDLYPHTGRTHQLRIHAAHIDGLNAPIIGDRLYGQGEGERLMLHAAEIQFAHPITKEEMHFCIPSNF